MHTPFVCYTYFCRYRKYRVIFFFILHLSRYFSFVNSPLTTLFNPGYFFLDTKSFEMFFTSIINSPPLFCFWYHWRAFRHFSTTFKVFCLHFTSKSSTYTSPFLFLAPLLLPFVFKSTQKVVPTCLFSSFWYHFWYLSSSNQRKKWYLHVSFSLFGTTFYSLCPSRLKFSQQNTQILQPKSSSSRRIQLSLSHCLTVCLSIYISLYLILQILQIFQKNLLLNCHICFKNTLLQLL